MSVPPHSTLNFILSRTRPLKYLTERNQALVAKHASDPNTAYPSSPHYYYILFMSHSFTFTVPKVWQHDPKPISFGDLEVMLNESWRLMLRAAMESRVSRGSQPQEFSCDVLKLGQQGSGRWRTKFDVTVDVPVGDMLNKDGTVAGGLQGLQTS